MNRVPGEDQLQSSCTGVCVLISRDGVTLPALWYSYTFLCELLHSEQEGHSLLGNFLLGDLQEPPGHGAGHPAQGGPPGAGPGPGASRALCQPQPFCVCVMHTGYSKPTDKLDSSKEKSVILCLGRKLKERVSPRLRRRMTLIRLALIYYHLQISPCDTLSDIFSSFSLLTSTKILYVVNLFALWFM